MKLKEEDVNSVLNFKKRKKDTGVTSFGFDPVLSHIYFIFAIVKGNFVIYSLLFKSEQRHIEYNISDLSVPDTVTVTDTGIRYRYLNGRTLL